MYDLSKSTVESVLSRQLNKRGIKLFVKRDDLIHPFVSGNKWRKLKYAIEATIQCSQSGVLTFGGAYSNHLLATAFACHNAGLKAIGFVRGEELTEVSNSMLQRCSKFGMTLHFVSRDVYGLRNERSYQEELLCKYPNMRILPEGGANYQGILGCMEILPSCEQTFDHVFVAQGTSTTSCGLLLSLPEHSILHVVPALKGFDSKNEMNFLLTKAAFDRTLVDEVLENVVVHANHHHGGYGKYTAALLDFMEDFYAETKIPLDPIYTGKAMNALYTWVEEQNIRDCSILFVHTGGIEGGKSIADNESRLFATFNPEV